MKVACNLAKIMRANGVTIAVLAARMGITQKRVRALRAADALHYATYCDVYQSVTGVNIFDRAFYDRYCGGR